MAFNLHTIMNDVSRSLDHTPVRFSCRSRVPMSELEAFVQIDPLLADLHKQYVDARLNRMNTAREFGSQDCMTEMALLVEDSAWCAMQTRYMEVRAERSMMVWAQMLMEESRLEEELLAEAEKKREARKFFEYVEFLSRIRQDMEKRNADLWLLVFLLCLVRGNVHAVQSSFLHNDHKLAA